MSTFLEYILRLKETCPEGVSTEDYMIEILVEAEAIVEKRRRASTSWKEFAAIYCVKEPTAKIVANKLFLAYKAWGIENGLALTFKSNPKLRQHLFTKGFDYETESSGRYVILGMMLRR